ncbi:GHKL domain-containing protein [Bifidobacterium samirii]|uniref:GHKL domain-containing protein n=2 Tax=Bifidobacterium samirii TaxID=2306974 RepID=A0A430FP54_9BIFI|nr:GHKL domain-containing protein [Bifidobacterium samirii]
MPEIPDASLITVLRMLDFVALRVVMPFFNGFIVELLACAAMFVWWLDRRPRFAWRVVVSLMTVLAVAVVTYWPIAAMNIAPVEVVSATIWIAIVRFVLLYAMCCWAMRFCYAMDLRQSVFYLIAAVSLQHFVYCGTRIVVLNLPGDWSDTTTWPGAMAFLVVSVMFLLLGYRLFAKPMEHRTPERLGRNILVLFLGLLLCVNVFSCLSGTSDQVGGPSLSAYLLLVATRFVTCAFVLALLAETANRIAAERDGFALQRMLDQQRAQMVQDKATVDLINVKTHDLKKQLALLDGRITREELDELRGLVDVYDASVRTGNEPLDVLLANKAMVCERQHVRFDRMIDGALIAFMKPTDIYSLFGNAIDNALEAVAKLPADADRYIAMTVREGRGMVLIHVENPYVGELRFDDGLPQTSKADRRYHGFGTRSMRMIAEHYDGVLSMDARDGVFSVDVLLPMHAD